MTETTDDAPARVINARVRPGGPLTDIHIADGRIAALRPSADRRPGRQPTGGETFDADGHLALPGLWDAHLHMVQWASTRRRIDLSGASSARHAARTMAEALTGATALTAATALTGATAPSPAVAGRRRVEPLIGYGFRDARWPDRPDPALLAWAGDHPVALVSGDLHVVWVNTAALRLIGPGPAGDDDGPVGAGPSSYGPDGAVLREGDAIAAAERLALADAATIDQWVGEALATAASRGVTGITDFEHADNITDWTRRAASGPMPARVICGIYPQFLDAAIDAGLRTGAVLPQTGGMARVGAQKLFVDGSLNARTALCNHPYPPPANGPAPADGTTRAGGGASRGVLVNDPDELRERMARAAAHGIESAVHAIGDRANTIALDLFYELGCPGRIEHAQLIDRADLPRLARPGLTVGIQPAHIPDDRDIADRHWAGRTDRAYAFADMARAGARLEIGSDAPVSALDPWVGIAAAVFRTVDARPGWHVEQALALDDALAAAARGRRGIAPGDPADLLITGTDPATCDAAQLREMPVAATMTAGRWTHRTA